MIYRRSRSATRSFSARVLVPNDFEDTAALAKALDDFADRYNQIAEPFEWNFTRECHRLPLQPADLPILPNGGTDEVEFVDLESANGLLEDPDYTTGAAHDEDNFHHMDRMTALQTTPRESRRADGPSSTT